MRVRQALRHRNLVLGAGLTGLILMLALAGAVWTPYAPTDLDIAARLSGPSAAHWLGTDYLGRDMLSLIMLGAQNSLSVALVAVGVGLAAGVPLGLAAAAAGGSLVDEAASRLTDLIFAFPAILSALLDHCAGRAGGDDRHPRYRHFQYRGLCPGDPRRRPASLWARIRHRSLCPRPDPP